MSTLEGHNIGIDLGTTHSAVAYVDASGKPTAIPDPQGHTMIPSVVLFQDDHVVVGHTAKQCALLWPTQVVSEIKREMGNPRWEYVYRGLILNPETISALILKKLKQVAAAQIGPIRGAVISVPYYFDDTRRKATQDAARIAGLNVIDIVNEHTAATLCYAYGRGQIGLHGEYTGSTQPESPRPVLVYDLGGGTFDVAYVKYTSRRFQVVATDGDFRLGGTDWTRRIVNFVAERFRERHGVDLREDPHSHQFLLLRCEEAKHLLSEKLRVNVLLEWAGKELDVVLTRDDFDRMTADLLLRTETTTCDVLEDAGVSWDELADIILVGGASRMPMVRKMLERVSGWLTYSGMPTGEAVAIGAAIHAAIMASQSAGSETANRSAFSHIEEINVNAHSLSIALLDPKKGRHRTEIMIPRNTPLPHAVTRRFSTVVPDQRGALVQVLEGEAPEPDECVHIGNCMLDELPRGLPAGSPIEVCYCYEPNGRVQVRARDPVGGQFAETDILHSAGLKSSQIAACRRFVDGARVE